eukprot:gnl/MRDRNA2_/MRDRNA2_73804_c0_seq2.p2 gnl/MRDRNA2_/MRDRNA2_73804_c0~~gnl/MRDRNA2_/MRDRNA2_73804_c0_seq2.p2  ORF type:complete len:167 (-),score=22.70 gnl/MRDRNA2_/MRDRNA2_73804_c0_seq2:244-744(-)
MDFDLRTYPPIAQFGAAAELVLNLGWDMVCANGYWGTGDSRRVYDAFATVLQNGTWLHGIRRTSAEEHAAFKFNVKLFHAIIASSSVYQVRSCFGGLSILRAQGLWDGAGIGCTYTSRPFSAKYYTLPGTGMCEHVALTECVREARQQMGKPPLRIGILPDLLTEW